MGQLVSKVLAMASFPVTNGVTTIVPPPEGYVVDFDNPQARNHVDHYFIFGVLGSLALFCLAQRLYTKQFIAGGLRVDDCASLAYTDQ